MSSKSSVDEYVSYYNIALSTLSDLKNSLENSGYSVFTKRIVFPEMSIDIKKKIIDKIELSRDTLVSIGYSSFEKTSLELVVEAVNRGFYTALYGLWYNPLEYSKIASETIHRISSIEPVYASRLAICFHREYIQTPYFPDTISSGVESIGLSFLLPKHIINYLKKGYSLDQYPLFFKKYIDDIENIVKETIGLNRVFFDYSISPWMDNSVVDLIEETGYRFLEPGFNYGVLELNNLINKLVYLGKNTSGFNEVMLPYAEDYRLIEAGGKKYLRARDLLLYTLTCVSGPDMIVVPESIDKLYRYILDTYSVWLVKNKPIALRAIPINGKPGDSIDLGKFGTVYVIDY